MTRLMKFQKLTVAFLAATLVLTTTSLRAFDIFNVDFEGNSANDTIGNVTGTLANAATFVADNGPSAAGSSALRIPATAGAGVGYPIDSFILHATQDNTLGAGDTLSLQFDVKLHNAGAGHASYIWSNVGRFDGSRFFDYHDGNPRWNVHTNDGNDFAADRWPDNTAGGKGMPASIGDLAANEWHTLKVVAKRNNAGNPNDFNWAVFHNGVQKADGSDVHGLADFTAGGAKGNFWVVGGRDCCSLDATIDNIIFARSVPEPASLLVALTGLASLLLVRRRCC